MHEGHRRRLYEKLKSGDNLYEHEVLEMLLFNAYPRINTNPIAHELLKRFPSIAAVLSADYEELITVPGVGEQAALYLMCVGRCLEKSNSADCFSVVKSRGDAASFVKLRFAGRAVEYLELYFLDKNGKVLRICSFTTGESHRVTVPPEEVIRLISVCHPYGILAAHNRTNGSTRPSVMDDDFTKELQIICSMNNVRLYDHMIYADGVPMYSYFDSGRMSEIESSFSINSILRHGRQG